MELLPIFCLQCRGYSALSLISLIWAVGLEGRIYLQKVLGSLTMVFVCWCPLTQARRRMWFCCYKYICCIALLLRWHKDFTPLLKCLKYSSLLLSVLQNWENPGMPSAHAEVSAQPELSGRILWGRHLVPITAVSVLANWVLLSASNLLLKIWKCAISKLLELFMFCEKCFVQAQNIYY